MSAKRIKNIANKYINILDEKKQQTSYKIKYISSYVSKWLFVMANRKDIKTINFIDSMCNAGVYKDGEIGTPIKVLELFRDAALQHQDKQFNLLLNDNNLARLEVIKQVVNEVLRVPIHNLAIYIENEDVNHYIGNVSKFKEQCGGFGKATILFVDPYDFRTVKLSQLKNFVRTYYCELLWNVFTNDFVRNIEHDKNKVGIINTIGKAVTNMTTLEQLVGYIRNEMVDGNIRHTFAYEFRNQKNAELYQIMFFTPNRRGLEKLKDALWDTFNGREFHINIKETGEDQMTIFDMLNIDVYKMDKEYYLKKYSAEAKSKIIMRFSNIEMSHEELEIYILENTMLMESHILRNVIKPLIAENQMIKKNLKSKSNYKDDFFVVKGVKDEVHN